MTLNLDGVKYVASYTSSKQLPFSARPEVSFVGRSNVGKSSLMNKLFRRNKLVRVSSKPGCTTAANFFNAGRIDFVDLPGYGFASVSKAERAKWKELIDGYFETSRRHALCVLLVDIRHDASPLDVQMVTYLQEHEIPFIIAFTKCDKIAKTKRRAQVSKICREFPNAGDTTVIICSAVSGEGLADLRLIIEDAVEQEREGTAVEETDDAEADSAEETSDPWEDDE